MYDCNKINNHKLSPHLNANYLSKNIILISAKQI